MAPSRTIPSVNTPIPTHCPVTGLPVFGHSSWRYNSPGGSYRLQVYTIGEEIVWLLPQGHVLFRHAQKSLELISDVLFAMLPGKDLPYTIINDFSAVTGVSLNARRYVMQTLRYQTQLETYIAYGTSKVIRRGLALSDLVGIYPFDFVVAQDYAEAVSTAHQRSSGKGEGIAPQADLSEPPAGLMNPPDLVNGDQPEAAISHHATELLVYMARINLETYGITSDFEQVSPDHPFRTVHDALAVLRDDMQAILKRHREALEKLNAGEKALMEKRALLNEAYTTLNILLETRHEERQRFENLINDRFNALLRPLIDGLEGTTLTARQHLLIQVLREVIDRICLPFPNDPERWRASLTPREQMVAHLLASGKRLGDIAHILGLSRRTVENHCQRMRAKAGPQGRRMPLRDWLAGRDEAFPAQQE